MGKYSIDDLRMANPRFRSADGSCALTFRAWGGVPWISINGTKDGSRIFSKNLKYEDYALLSQFITEFMKAEPGKESSFVYNSYNFKEKKRIMDFILVLKKDEKSVFHITIKANNNMYDFPIIFGNNIAYGTGEIPEGERSYRAMKFLSQHLTNVIPIELQLTSTPMERQNGGNNYSGRSGGYNKPSGGGYSGQGDFQSQKNLPSDDDIFSQD